MEVMLNDFTNHNPAKVFLALFSFWMGPFGWVHETRSVGPIRSDGPNRLDGPNYMFMTVNLQSNDLQRWRKGTSVLWRKRLKDLADSAAGGITVQ